MATVTDAPKALRMTDFYGYSGDHGGLLKSARFIVRIMPQGRLITPQPGLTPITRDLMYLCEIADMPGRSFDTFGVRYYGPQEFFPMLSNYMNSEISFTFLCRNQGVEREFFDNWMTLINPPNTFDFNYRDDYKAEIDVFQFSDVGEEPTANYKITLINAWPSMLSPQPMTWADDNFQRLVMTFNFTKWIRKGIDPEPRTDQSGYSYKLVKSDGVTVSPRAR
jgi:hypothetical protein